MICENFVGAKTACCPHRSKRVGEVAPTSPTLMRNSQHFNAYLLIIRHAWKKVRSRDPKSWGTFAKLRNILRANFGELYLRLWSAFYILLREFEDYFVSSQKFQPTWSTSRLWANVSQLRYYSLRIECTRNAGSNFPLFLRIFEEHLKRQIHAGSEEQWTLFPGLLIIYLCIFVAFSIKRN